MKEKSKTVKHGKDGAVKIHYNAKGAVAYALAFVGGVWIGRYETERGAKRAITYREGLSK